MGTSNGCARCRRCGFEAARKYFKRGLCVGCQDVTEQERNPGERWWHQRTVDWDRTLVWFQGKRVSFTKYMKDRKRRLSWPGKLPPIMSEIADVQIARTYVAPPERKVCEARRESGGYRAHNPTIQSKAS